MECSDLKKIIFQFQGSPELSNGGVDVGEVETSAAEETGDKDVVSRSLEQRSWRLRELMESEHDYVNDLAQVLWTKT